MDIEDIVYGEVSEENKGIMARELKFLPDIKNPERMVPMPFENSSLETEDDLISISSLPGELSDDEMKSIDEQDEDFVESSFVPYLKDNGIDVNEDDIYEIVDDIASIVMKAKYKFNRPRPEQLAEFHNVEIKPREGKSANSPSYPSGHSAQATFLARMLGDQNPKHRVGLMEIGEEIGINRLKGNFHYPSDHEAGVKLGKDLYDLYKVNKASDTKIDKEKRTKYI
tara:strand:- start:1251 stop:1928 length:678 start_codon:yes stop_codon:yes gene_type:complete